MFTSNDTKKKKKTKNLTRDFMKMRREQLSREILYTYKFLEKLKKRNKNCWKILMILRSVYQNFFNLFASKYGCR